MKKILLVLCIITGLSACRNETGSPTVAINGMFAAMKSGNIEEMKKFITKSDAAMMEAGEKLLNSIDPEAIKKIKDKMTGEFKEKAKNITYSLKNEKIDGDIATVEAEVMEDGKTSTHQLELVKEEGDWKIALSKPGNGMFNSMKGNMGKERDGRGLEDGLERLKNMDRDSLKMLINKGLQALDSLDGRKNKN